MWGVVNIAYSPSIPFILLWILEYCVPIKVLCAFVPIKCKMLYNLVQLYILQLYNTLLLIG